VGEPVKQREVQAGGLSWTCVQALAGVDGEAAAAAQEKLGHASSVAVVCTPSGSAQSVRLQLAPDWTERLSDEQLAEAIQGVRKA